MALPFPLGLGTTCKTPQVALILLAVLEYVELDIFSIFLVQYVQIGVGEVWDTGEKDEIRSKNEIDEIQVKRTENRDYLGRFETDKEYLHTPTAAPITPPVYRPCPGTW